MILKLDKQHEPLKTTSNSILDKMRKIELLTKNTADKELADKENILVAGTDNVTLDRESEPGKTIIKVSSAPVDLSEYAKTTEVQALVANEATRATGVEGELDDLETEANTNLVAAINEININASNAQTAADNASSKADATAQEVTVHTENTNIHVTGEEHSGLQDLLNPYAPINRSGMINVGEDFGNKKIARFCLAELADLKPGSPTPVPAYSIYAGDPKSEITPTELGTIPHMHSQSIDAFISAFNSKFPNIKATYIGDLKNAGDKLYNNGTRALIELELINDWADRNDIFIVDIAMAHNTFGAIQTADGRWYYGSRFNALYMYFKDHTSLDITLNGESVWGHITNTNIHTTTEEKAEWNNKQDALQYYTESTNSVVIGDTDTNATVTLKCGSTEVVLDEATLIKFKQLLNTLYVYPENG